MRQMIAILGMAALALAAGPLAAQTPAPATTTSSMPIGVVGLSHDHVNWLFGDLKRGDVRIVGIVEPDHALAKQYADRYGLSPDLFYDDLAAMLDKTHPVAVAGFGAIADHITIVRAAAPRGIHVMVEKPLALNAAEAREIISLATKNHVEVLTNYETTWYPTAARAADLIQSGSIGPVHKLVFHDGHQGPVKIGVSPSFLAWLTDPARNGGGAIIDFGCYGANQMTWLTHGERPVSVTAVTRHFQPDAYPNVDDDATVLVDYPDAQGIIQASWDWPVSRKDMEIYGTTGQIIADDKHSLRVWQATPDSVQATTLADRAAPYDDPFAYFRAVVEGQVVPAAYDPSTLANNLLVMEILDAARESARTGKTVQLPPAP